jgi:hypothetical protein
MTSAPGRGSLVSITFPLMENGENAPFEAVDDIETGPLTHDREGI